MKTLDRYIAKSFLIPFITSFLIVMFVLVMQALWLVFDAIAGKGIGLEIIGKFVWYMCLFVAPQALPISVLLASIMTLGNLGEHYEYAAIKSAGISFFRFLRPLLVTIGIITVANFFLLNYTFPYASLKQKNLLLNIKKTQPTLALVEGSFNSEIPGFSIKFSKKYGPELNLLKDVMIIDTKGIKEDHIVITAKRGKITSEEGSRYMTLILEDGYYFQDHSSNQTTIEKMNMAPSSQVHFNKYTVNIDLSALAGGNLEEEGTKNHYSMKNMSQLQVSSDSLKYSYNIYLNSLYKVVANDLKIIGKPVQNSKDYLLNNFDQNAQKGILIESSNLVKNRLADIQGYKDYYKDVRKDLNVHDYQFHYILTNSMSCLLLFFVGASLGSLIRKGGFGLPMVIAIIIYVSYHFSNTFGKNMVEESSLTAVIGGWLGTILMTPLAIYFTYKALKDVGFVNFDWISIPIKNLIIKLKKND